MLIELFGIARARAGRDQVTVEAADLGGALRALAVACPELVPEILADGRRLTDGYLASLNGEGFVADENTPLGAEDTLQILGAQAGG